MRSPFARAWSWLRGPRVPLYAGTLMVARAYGDGQHDDTQAFRATLEAARSMGVPMFVSRKGVFRISRSLSMRSGDRIYGEGKK